MLIENKDARLYHLPGLTLMPGMNDVAPTTWGAASNNAVAKSLIEAGVLIAPEENSPKAVDVLDSLAGISAAHAIELVGKTMDKALLLKWAAIESRKKVKEALDAQFDAIDPSKKD